MAEYVDLVKAASAINRRVAEQGESTRIVANRLAAKFPFAGDHRVAEATSTFLSARLKRLESRKSPDRSHFKCWPVHWLSMARTASRRSWVEMIRAMPVGVPVDHVTSANGRDCREQLQALQPHVVVVE